jgi:putative alpha-1,2-mannosidase
MNKRFKPKTTILTLAVACLPLLFAQAQQPNYSGEGNLKYVDPRIGNVGAILEPTRPTIQLPNQVIRMTPQRADYMDDQISNFPLTVVSHRNGQVFSVKPALNVQDTKRMTYDHDLEINRPWYYSTYLIDSDIKVEFTPGKKAGIFKFDFPHNSTKALIFDKYNGGESQIQLASAREITGMETWDGVKVFMYGTLNADATAEKNGNKLLLSFNKEVKTIELKYALSFVSADQAKKNYNNELKATTFDQQVKLGEAAWSKVINQIKATGGTEAQKRSFYTALYRCYERMVDITEDGQYYSGYDDWVWDTYLAHHPLRTILDPAQEGDMLNSYVLMYQQSGWVPTFPLLYGDNPCMNGFHSTITFLDGYRKGIRNYDVNVAYEGMLKNATQATMLPWKNGPKTDLEDFYYEKGYFPALKIGEQETNKTVHGFEKRQAVAITQL